MAAKTKPMRGTKKPVNGKTKPMAAKPMQAEKPKMKAKVAGAKIKPVAVVRPVVQERLADELREKRVAAPRVPNLPPVSLQAMMRGTVSDRDVLWLVFGYLWRSWLVALVWSGIMMVVAYVALGEVPLAADAEARMLERPMWLLALDLGGSLVLGMAVFYWLMAAEKMWGGIELAATLQPKSWFGRTPVRQACRLWWSFTWRSLLWALLGLILGIAVMFLNGLISLSFAELAMVLDYVLMAVGMVWFMVFVPWMVWRQILRRRVFGWGMVELKRVGE